MTMSAFEIQLGVFLAKGQDMKLGNLQIFEALMFHATGLVLTAPEDRKAEFSAAMNRAQQRATESVQEMFLEASAKHDKATGKEPS